MMMQFAGNRVGDNIKQFVLVRDVVVGIPVQRRDKPSLRGVMAQITLDGAVDTGSIDLFLTYKLRIWLAFALGSSGDWFGVHSSP